VTIDRRRLASVALVAGLGLAGFAQLMASTHIAPLFDGVLVEDPYRFVEPQGSAAGDPLAAEQTQAVVNGAVSLLAVGTAEVPPQAQIIAQADAFDIPGGTTSITVTIRPTAPTDPQVVGNVYSLNVTDQAGVPLNLRPGSLVTMVQPFAPSHCETACKSVRSVMNRAPAVPSGISSSCSGESGSTFCAPASIAAASMSAPGSA